MTNIIVLVINWISPAFMPASSAGEPAIGATIKTLDPSFVGPTVAPIPKGRERSNFWA